MDGSNVGTGPPTGFYAIVVTDALSWNYGPPHALSSVSEIFHNMSDPWKHTGALP